MRRVRAWSLRMIQVLNKLVVTRTQQRLQARRCPTHPPKYRRCSITSSRADWWQRQGPRAATEAQVGSHVTRVESGGGGRTMLGAVRSDSCPDHRMDTPSRCAARPVSTRLRSSDHRPQRPSQGVAAGARARARGRAWAVSAYMPRPGNRPTGYPHVPRFRWQLRTRRNSHAGTIHRSCVGGIPRRSLRPGLAGEPLL
jgi:hypothetical protein